MERKLRQEIGFLDFNEIMSTMAHISRKLSILSSYVFLAETRPKASKIYPLLTFSFEALSKLKENRKSSF